MQSYLSVVIFTVAGFVFVGFSLQMARLLRPSAPNPDKLVTYECGPLPFGDAWRQFNMHYYLITLLFVVFDVEAAFLFPWALAFRSFGAYAVAELFIFVGVLAYGWLYALRRGAMEWE